MTTHIRRRLQTEKAKRIGTVVWAEVALYWLRQGVQEREANLTISSITVTVDI